MSSKKALLYSILISLAIALVVEHRVFYDLTAINDDVRNQIYWMARFIDPNYFSNDYVASYFTQSSMISPLLSWIYQFFSQWVDPKVITQFLPFPIIILTTIFLFKATEIHGRSQILFTKLPDARHASPENAELTDTSMSSSRDEHNKADGTLWTGSKYALWVCYVFNLYIWTMKYTAGGLPRSFFYLLFFLFLWIFAAKRWKWLIPCFILQALIYPTAFFISLMTLIVEMVWTKLQQIKSSKRQTFFTLIALAAGIFVLYLRYIVDHTPNAFGRMTSLKEAIKMPEFYIDGRACVFIVPFNFNLSFKYFPCILVCLLVIWGAYYLLKKLISKRVSIVTIPRYIWSSSIASIILLVIAYLVLFYLYLPHRYIAYILPLIPIFLLGSILYDIDLALPKRPIAVWLITLLALLLIAPHWNDDLIEVSAPEQKLHQFLKTIPSDALIAAPLKLASNIPAFSYRSVLVSSETNIPFHVDYYKEIKADTKAIDLIYNSNDPIEITKIINQYGIDYVVLDLKSNGDSILPSIPSNKVIYSTKRFIVIKAK